MNKKDKCPKCAAPKHLKADRCRECYNKDRINENKHWEVHYARIDNARKKKLLKMLNASSSDVIKSSTIVYCYYHRPTRKNFLAWRHGDVSKWLKENGLERNDYIKTVCALSEVNINLTGIDLSEYTTLGQTG